jgi:hypothetical protein
MAFPREEDLAMEGMNWWDIGLIAAAGYLAAVALTRLMLAYRDAKIGELKRLFEEHQRSNQAKANESKQTPRNRSAA